MWFHKLLSLTHCLRLELGGLENLLPSILHPWNFLAFSSFSCSWSCLSSLLFPVTEVSAYTYHHCLVTWDRTGSTLRKHKVNISVLKFCANGWHSLGKGSRVHSWQSSSSDFGSTAMKNAASLAQSQLNMSERARLCLLILGRGSKAGEEVSHTVSTRLARVHTGYRKSWVSWQAVRTPICLRAPQGLGKMG